MWYSITGVSLFSFKVVLYNVSKHLLIQGSIIQQEYAYAHSRWYSITGVSLYSFKMVFYDWSKLMLIQGDIL